MSGLVGLGGTLALLLVSGTVVGYLDEPRFALRWLLIAVLVVAVNDVLLTNAYGSLPDVIGGAWNWQGKLLALAATLAIAGSTAFGFHRVGLTIVQAPDSLKTALPVAALYGAFFVFIAIVFPGGRSSSEEVAFQLTMPGLEEEPLYRGILLFALDHAFTGRKRLLGVEWSRGAVLSCLLFGMAHAFGFSHGRFSFDPMMMALTAIPSFMAVWLRLRTGSLLLPIVLHNFGNSFSLFV